MIKTVANAFGLQLQEVWIPFQASCPIAAEPYGGEIHIALFPANKCLEYISLEEYIQSFKGKTMLHEQVCRDVYNAIQKAVLPSLAIDYAVEVEVTSEGHVHARAALGNLRRLYTLRR